MIAAVSVLVLYAGLTLGAQAVSAIGVGVAKPPKNVADTAYVGVRLDHTELADGVLLDEIQTLGVSVVVDARAATHRSVELETLADQGVDIANGGWGKGSFLRWNRAHNDVSKAGKLIAQEAGQPAREFCPGRRLDAFDQYYSHRQKQKLVQAEPHGPPGEPADAARVGQGLRARRSRPRPHGDGGRGRRPRGAVRARRPARRARSGSCAEPRAPAEVRRGSGAGGSGRAGGPARRAGARAACRRSACASRPRWSGWAGAVTSRSPSTTGPTRRRPRSSSTRSTISDGTRRSSCSVR